jgi:DNA-binding NtrC family response regulator
MIAAAVHGGGAKRGPRVIVTIAGEFEEAVDSKRLHPDLAAITGKYHRLCVPPLSKRVADIPLLADAFVKGAAAAANRPPKAIKPATEDFLKRRTWKGNVRELKAVVERATMESEGDELDLPTELIDETAQLRGIISNIADRRRFSFDKSLSNLEKTLIERTLREVSANQSHAAEILNLSEANLRYRMKKFKIRGGI